MEKRKGISYKRVSTDGQFENGYGLAAQEDKIQEYCEKNNIELVEAFTEEGVSGGKNVEERIAFAQLLMYLDENKDIEVVVIPALDRLARDLMIQESAIKDLHSKGIELISVREPDLLGDDPSRVLMRQILGAYAQYEKSMITARLKAGRMIKAKQGQHAQGRVALGYKTEVFEGRKVLKVDEEEARIVRTVFELREQGLSYRKIAKHLNENDFKPKNWTPEKPTSFFDSTVRKILANPKYEGKIELHENGEVIAESKNEKLIII